MTHSPADQQGRPHPDRRVDPDGKDATETTPHNPGGLMPDIRGDADGQGRDPEEVDPIRYDEDLLRRKSGDPGVEKP